MFLSVSRWGIQREKWREVYAPFVVGNGLSVSFGVVGGMIIKFIMCEKYKESFLIGGALILFTLILGCVIKFIIKNPKKV